MADNTPTRMPRPPKLRASCDECGSAKLKCDRNQPNCGRCISLCLKCVYGVSQKAGKPRRALQDASCPPSTPKSNPFGPNTNGPPGSTADSTAIGSSLPRPPNWKTDSCASYMAIDDLCSWHTKDPFHLGNGAGSSVFDSLLDSASLFPMTDRTPDLGSYSSPDWNTAIPQSHVHSRADHTSVGERPADSSEHNCFREAFAILGSLSSQTPVVSQPFPSAMSMPSSTSTPESTTRLPLDHVLGLSREAIRRLGPLLVCSCARSPHLALLYASIISQILIWYHQAVYDSQSTPSDSNTSLPGSESHQPSNEGSISSSTTTRNVTQRQPSPTRTKSTVLSITPIEMAIGTFNVDDLRVQAAVKVQLLSGEIRRAGNLIDQFTSRSTSGPYGIGEDIIGGAGSLYQSLDSWLRGKHSSLANLTRSKLRELDS
jgi:hypothetical protein